MTIGLTPKQKAVLDFIEDEIERTSICPTHREIKDRFGWKSDHQVAAKLDSLEAKGMIRRVPGKIRNITVANNHITPT